LAVSLFHYYWHVWNVFNNQNNQKSFWENLFFGSSEFCFWILNSEFWKLLKWISYTIIIRQRNVAKPSCFFYIYLTTFCVYAVLCVETIFNRLPANKADDGQNVENNTTKTTTDVGCYFWLYEDTYCRWKNSFGFFS
jgi:hypothetical protein